MMVTPVHDRDWKEWSLDGETGQLKDIKDTFTDYLAPGFREYLGRGWCRLEMFLNANMPTTGSRKKLFAGKLRHVMEEKRRPHLLYGTREKDLDDEPHILRPLTDEEFEVFHPGHGMLFDQQDKEVIDAYVEELCKINTNLRV